MRKCIFIFAFLLIFTGCATRPTAESVYSTPHLTLPEPALSAPPATEPVDTTPEATEPDPTVPFEITAEEVAQRLNGVFTFGKLTYQEMRYYWYPMTEPHEPEDYNFAEARFTYNNIEYVARVKQTPCRMSLVFEDIEWDAEIKETEILRGLTGIIRKCRVGKDLYTNILWYDTNTKCTYSLFWKGGREDYIKLAPIIFGFPGTQVTPG